MSTILQLFCQSDTAGDFHLESTVNKLRKQLDLQSLSIKEESCFYIVVENNHLNDVKGRLDQLKKLLSHNVFNEDVTEQSKLTGNVVEIGPR